MGLELFCPKPREPVPKRVWLRLICDGAHRFGKRLVIEVDGYSEQRKEVVRQGWLIASDGLVWCPNCKRGRRK